LFNEVFNAFALIVQTIKKDVSLQREINEVMSTIGYIEAQQNFADILQKATKENIIINGIDGNKFMLSIFRKTLPNERKQKLSERFAGALCLTDEEYNDFQTQLLESRNEWERNTY